MTSTVPRSPPCATFSLADFSSAICGIVNSMTAVIDAEARRSVAEQSISSAREDESQKYFRVGTRSDHSKRRSSPTRRPGGVSHSMIDAIGERERGTTYDPDRSVTDFVM